jgi:alkylation response protein AidB-like acyl-CoA dehydrogenase
LSRPDPIAAARALGPMIAEAAAGAEARRRVDDGVIAAFHDAGFFRLLTPASLGGAEAGPSVFVQVIEALARADASPAWVLCQMAVCAVASAYLEPGAAEEIFGDARAALAWGSTRDAKAVAVPGGYRVSGSWEFGSGLHHATWLGGHCPVVDEAGAPLTNGPADRTVLFPRAAAEVVDVWRVLGLRATGSDTYRLEGLFVPHAHAITAISHWPDSARRAMAAPFRFSVSGLYAAGFGALALGNARGMLDAFIAFAADKTPLWRREPIAKDPRIQLAVAQAHVSLEAARVYLVQTLRELEAAAMASELTADQRLALRAAGTHAIRAATDASRVLFDLSGASILADTDPAQRRFRDAQAIAQHLQGRVSHLEGVGRHLLGVGSDLRFA